MDVDVVTLNEIGEELVLDIVTFDERGRQVWNKIQMRKVSLTVNSSEAWLKLYISTFTSIFKGTK